MVYVEKYKVKGKTYFKLVHTIRKGNIILHKRKYIGRTLPSKQRLEQLKSGFLRQLHSQKYKHLSSKDVEDIEDKKFNYKKELKSLSSIEKKKKLKEFIIRFTYDSSKLAGVAITLRQTSLILKEGIIPRDIKSLRAVKEIENHEKGVIAITKYKGNLDVNFIKKLHLILFSGVEDSIAGKLRYELKRDVKLAGTVYVPPKWHELRKELSNFFKWYNVESKKFHPLELAALIHLKLISLQPFVDGNSRLSRLLMNWILWKRGYPAINIPIEDLENYYNALDKYQIEKDEKAFIDYIKRVYLKSK
ncbi:Fic family protein [Candidatus Woesearchaeota archaeon]|nr:Fic family protein [Candidatus Woesearchaeota archaeon]